MSRSSPPDRVFLANHWHPREGWTPGRALLTAYVTIPDQPELQAAVVDFQGALADLPECDLIDQRWLHVSVQGTAFLDELPADCLPRLVAALRPRLVREIAPVLRFDRPIPGGEAIYMIASPGDELWRIRAQVRLAVAETFELAEPYALPGERRGVAPHLSIAYPNAPIERAVVIDRLAAVAYDPLTVTVSQLSVLVLRQTDHTWQWTDEVRIPIGVESTDGTVEVSRSE